MSWFTDLAGKAEDLLNRVDQGAASALSKKENLGPATYSNSHLDEVGDYPKVHQQAREQQQFQASSKSSFISSAADNIKHQKATILAGTANVKLASRTSVEVSPSVEVVSVARPSSQFVRRKKSEPNDELLFDFLNSSEKEPNGKKDLKIEKSRAAVTQNHSRSSSVSSVSASSQSLKMGEDASVPSQGNETPDSSSSGLETEAEVKKESLQGAEANPSLAINDNTSHELSNLRLENQLLRNEVQSLNQEMASLIQRAKETQTELNNARARVEKWNADHSNSDRLVRELQAQVDDLTEAAAAKDSQLAVLKVRLQEADQLLNSRNKALEALQSEKSRILQDNSEGTSMHNQALQTLQERLHDAESALRREQEGYKQMQNEFAGRLSKMEAERQNLAEAVTAAERKFVEEKRKADELQQQARIAKANLESAKQELVDYKQKATRILQSKEKLINSLKEGSGIEGLDSQTASIMELEELRHERETQKEEMQKLRAQIHQLRIELQDMETQQISETESTREQIQDLQDQIETHKTAKQEVEAELERQKQELRYTEEELYRTKNTLQSRISDREEEIQKLRNQLTNKTLGSSSQSELENRLHQLTETLIQKQTMLENLSTEKNSLVYQLERLEQQMKAVQGPSTNGPTINMAGIESSEGTRMRNVPVLFSDVDMNVAGMYAKVRRAASSIDRFSIRLGIFLRRYPIARVFVIIYMALLHSGS
nr:PREDICTED: golgin subfamily A member 5 isoform X1 [Anolis carolinensis]XP_008110091.1 PREDICTED: golgin subfamily A member 5 isoform X1 [Anolis carolinensis]XP_008110143.1 PREDICTED: golgin subfamily A member 5 isoform X1 [Anolis carolinensis]XP_008110210.1 PREDICTED: golgin subfamily A member 5 isoform X1 [Anolis carolinensis]|eukprot:XP_008110041.1 PREDICTED: golgin subfamily A member 5 isoform X1 [Anolis carolinensis]